ncbi:YncE family protein [Streptosporangium lutulentum]
MIDAATTTITTTVTVGGNPQEVAVTPDGTRAYVTNFDGTSNSVSVIDTATTTVIATIGVGGNPYGVAITPTVPAPTSSTAPASAPR